MTVPSRTIRLLLQSGWFVVVLASLTQPALLFDRPFPKDLSGVEVLGMGWLGVIVLDPRWYANVFFLRCAYTNLRGRKPARVAAVLGLSLVAASVLLPINYFPNDHAERVDALGAGAWLWAAALAGTFLQVLAPERRTPAASQDEPTRPATAVKLLAVLIPVVAVALMWKGLFPGRARYSELCKGAEIVYEVPVRHARSVYLGDDNLAFDGPSIRTDHNHTAEFLLAQTSLEYVERQTHRRPGEPDPAGIYERILRRAQAGTEPSPGSAGLHREFVAAPDAEYVAVGTDLSEPGVAEGLGGARIDVFEAKGLKRRVAHAKYFWLGRNTCPSDARGQFFRFAFLARALGLDYWGPVGNGERN